MKEIAVVEDDAFMREELSDLLRKGGFLVYEITEFNNVTERLLSLSPNLVLLDIGLPGKSGFQICKELKGRSAIPVLVLTSREGLSDELHALDLGADEYLLKPCRKERLLARIENLLKRFEGREQLLEGRGFLLDKNTFTIYIGGRSEVLPPNQGKLLSLFLREKEEVITKEALHLALWGTTEFIDENALQVNLTRLKKTMAELRMEGKVTAVRGKGYLYSEKEKKDGR